jgi:hypothetical protein
MSFHLYADDDQLYTTFACNDDVELYSVISRLESCLADINNWMTCNKLKLNADKTDFLIFHSNLDQCLCCRLSLLEMKLFNPKAKHAI